MAGTDRYRRLTDLPARLPVFPLRGAILLPRMQLPLNVFEPRYLEMVGDVMAGGRLIGIIQPERSESEAESPQGADVALKPVGCAGRVTAYQELDDGRLMIVLTGIMRFAVEREQPTGKPYRQFAVDYRRYAVDLEQGVGEAALDREALIAKLKNYLEHRQLRADWNAIASTPGEHLVNMLCMGSPFGSEEKQALLEAPDLKTRAEMLIALAEMDMASGHRDPGTRLQ